MAWVRKLEHRMLSGTVSETRATDGSLLRLSRNARPLASTVGTITRIITIGMPSAWNASPSSPVTRNPRPAEMATCLLDTLFVSMCEDDGLVTAVPMAPATVSSHKLFESCLSIRLLLEAIRPQVMILGTWIQDGCLHDIHSECFIQGVNADTEPRAAKFWTSAYGLRSASGISVAASTTSAATDLSSVPLLFKSVARDILAGGKSSIVCAEDGVSETPSDCPRAASCLYRSFQHELIQKLEMQFAGQSQAAYAHSVTRQTVWQDCLASMIRFRCTKQTQRLAKRLMVQHRLEVYLDVLHACFFMGDGHFTAEVCRYCYGKVDRRETWDDRRVLVALFADVLQKHGLTGSQLQEDCVSVEMEGKPARPGRADIYAFDQLFVGFKPPWPISIIIDDECIDRYNRIFRLLLQVKRAKYALDNLFVRRSAGMQEGSSTQSALLFQAELMHFVNNLHYYLMNRLAFGEWATFKSQLHRAEDMDTITALYWRYLTVVHDQCLLSPKAKYVMDAILKILDIVLETKQAKQQQQEEEEEQQQQQHTAAAAKEKEEGAEDDEEKKEEGGMTKAYAGDGHSDITESFLRLQRQCSRFRRLHKLLMQVLSTVVAQGSDASHFEDLAMRLDFNGFYAKGH